MPPVDPTPTASTSSPSSPMPTASMPTPPPLTPPASSQVQPTPPVQSGSHKKAFILGGLAIVILLIVGGVFLYLATKNQTAAPVVQATPVPTQSPIPTPTNPTASTSAQTPDGEIDQGLNQAAQDFKQLDDSTQSANDLNNL